MSDTGVSLPKFGEWDVNDPTSAESFTKIFNLASVERKTGNNNQGSNSPAKELSDKQGTTLSTSKPSSRKWFCCLKSTPAES